MFTMDNLISAFSSAWQRSFDYTGRSNQGDYWWFTLSNLIISVVLVVLSAACGMRANTGPGSSSA
jgi:uncharacterized membrane protein YhaH (DUF805 family)